MKKYILIVVLIFFYKEMFSQTDSLQLNNTVYKEFNYKNGKIASKGYLNNNQPTGFWKSYFITGIKKSEGKWLNNQLDSVWIFYNQFGDTTQKINYYQGKKNGYDFKYNKSIITSKELYINGKRNGKSLYYFESNKLKMIVPYKDDKKQGIGFEYNNNGDIITITRFRNNEIIVEEYINRFNKEGKKEDTWKEFYDNGILRVEKNFDDGKLNGYFKLYNEEGKLLESIKYKNNEVDLESIDFDTNIEIKDEYDSENNLIFQGSYNKEIPIGVHRYFNNVGVVTKSNTYNIKGKLISDGVVLISGRESGVWIYYYETGEKKAHGKYINGKKSGIWIYYYITGRKQQSGSYSNGKLTGMWKWYYETGELLKEEYYIYGLLDGEAFEYNVFEEIISKGNYIEGNKEGEWIYSVGDQKNIGKYVLNEKDGEWKSYYLDENIISFEGKYIQGNPDGKHKYYYPDGTIKEERYFDEGMKVKAWSKYNEHGDLVIVVEYKDGREFKINGVKIKLYNNDN